MPDDAVATDPQEPLSEPEDRIAFIADEAWRHLDARPRCAHRAAHRGGPAGQSCSCRPTNKSDPGADCAYPVCFVNGTLHIPRPHEVWVAGGEEPATGLMTFQVSLTDTLFTMIVITIVVLLRECGRDEEAGRPSRASSRTSRSGPTSR